MASEQTPGNVAHIIVVDDDPDQLEFSRFVLGSAGYRLSAFQDAAEALRCMEKDPPDLLITDLMMDSLDAGFSLAERVKNNPAWGTVPVILMTAVESQRGFDFTPRTPEDLAAMHADAFFTKPINPQALLAKVRELLA